jgi:hypothetical protein
MTYDGFMAEKEGLAKTTVKSSSSKFVILALIIAVLAIICAIYFYTKYSSTQVSSTTGNKEQIQQLINRVSKLMALPKNETPTVATVSDKTKLEDQSFFTNAENGDKVLIYSQAKKAILYRPSTNMIIDVAPVNLGANVSSNQTTTTVASAKEVSSSPTPTTKLKSVTLLILNGTKTSGVATTAKNGISEKISQISQISVGDSVSNYTKTIIVDPGLDKALDDQLVAVVGGTVVKTLPSGEKAAKQDIVIIVGEDYKK